MPAFIARFYGRGRAVESSQLDRPVGIIEETLPTLVLTVRELEPQGRAGFGLDRFLEEFHPRLPGRPASLTDVALQASADDVFPGGAAAPAPGKDVVEAQLAGREPLAAVLAAVAVAGEDVPPVE